MGNQLSSVECTPAGIDVLATLQWSTNVARLVTPLRGPYACLNLTKLNLSMYVFTHIGLSHNDTW